MLLGAALLGVAVWALVTSRTLPLFVVAIVGPIAVLVLSRMAGTASLEASRLARTDHLTGLGNGRAFLEQLERFVARAAPTRAALTLCLIDVDDFKRINDRFGHPAGDHVLAEVGRSLRSDGEAFRLGGDEFALLLAGHDEADGLAVAETVLSRISSAEYSHGSAVTASAGLVSFPRHTLDGSELVRSPTGRSTRPRVTERRAYGPTTSTWASLRNSGPSRRAVLGRRMSRASASAVGTLAARVAVRMGLSTEQVELIKVAGTLNDIGKLALPSELVHEARSAHREERRTLERHPEIGSRILESLGVDPVATWVRHHHERWDGSGYPERLSGERIPLGARIIFVADAYEAMTTDQAWRARLTQEAAILELERCAGSQFDPDVVAAFVAELESRVGERRESRIKA